MKNSVRILTLAFIVLFIFPIQAFAVDFMINEITIDAYIQDDGEVKVEESLTYTFDGDFNGITRSLIPNDGTSITNLTATENGKSLKVEKDDETFLIYRSGEDETITINLTYIIMDSIKVYEDMAQFYWSFFDSSNESDFENLTVTIHPPQSTSDVIAYGFDEAYGSENIAGNGEVTFEMGLVESGENGDINVAYDRSIFSIAPTHSGLIRDKLIEEKQKLEEKRANFLKRQDVLDQAAVFVVNGYGILLLLLVFYAWRKYQGTKLEAERLYHSNSLVPRDLMSMPATVYYYRNYMVESGELLSVGLMDLVRKGKIKVLEDETFQLDDSNTDSKHESLLIELLFNKVSKGKLFSFDQLDGYLKTTVNQMTFRQELMTYQKLIREEIDSHYLFNKHTLLRWSVVFVSFFLVPFMILLGIHGLAKWIFFSIVIMIGLLLFALLFHPRSAEGRIIKKQWTEFKNEVLEIDTENWNNWSKDEKERALIFTSGLKDKKLKEKHQTFIGNQSTDDNYQALIMMLMLSTLANTRFQSATDASAATSDFSSSGGGGAGGGGGGGGAGAF